MRILPVVLVLAALSAFAATPRQAAAQAAPAQSAAVLARQNLEELAAVATARRLDPAWYMLYGANCELLDRYPAAADAYTRERLADMLNFFELMTQWYDSTRRMPTAAVIRLCKLGDKVARFRFLVRDRAGQFTASSTRSWRKQVSRWSRSRRGVHVRTASPNASC